MAEQVLVGGIRFPGHYCDEETGVHYNRHRYYDPKVGRYVSADPIGQAGGINLYGYTLNDPVNGTDPLGLVGPLWFEVVKRLAKEVIGAKPVNEAETVDTDEDGIPDWQDGLPNYPGCCVGPWTPPEGPAFPDRPPSAFPDTDGDGYPDAIDPTPEVPGWDPPPATKPAPDDCDQSGEGAA